MDVADLPHVERRDVLREGSSTGIAEERRSLPDAPRRAARRLEPGDPGATSPSSTCSAAKPGTRAAIIASQPATSTDIGPAWSKLGASGKTPSVETRP